MKIDAWDKFISFHIDLLKINPNGFKTIKTYKSSSFLLFAIL
jgi:hypothetical protein